MKNDFTPYVVNFFTQREYEKIPDMLEEGWQMAKLVTSPKDYEIQRMERKKN